MSRIWGSKILFIILAFPQSILPNHDQPINNEYFETFIKINFTLPAILNRIETE